MRIVSLVPAATEMVVALGAEESLVGISHECDWPPSVQNLPRVTTTPIQSNASSSAIDSQVRRLNAEGIPVIGVDAGVLSALAPDLIITQDLCEVCAITDDGVASIAATLHPAPRTLQLKARTLEGIFSDIAALGAAIELADEAEELVAGLCYPPKPHPRGFTVKPGDVAPESTSHRPRVVCIEWLDPIYLAGHWVPELIAAAGGDDVGARPGSHSQVVTLEAVRALVPELVIVAPCGFGLDRAEAEFREFQHRTRPDWRAPVWLLDGNAYTSRPGPRVVDGALRIAAALSGTELPGLRRWRGAGATGRTP